MTVDELWWFGVAHASKMNRHVSHESNSPSIWLTWTHTYIYIYSTHVIYTYIYIYVYFFNGKFSSVLGVPNLTCNTASSIWTGILVMKPKRIACHYLRTLGCYIYTCTIYTSYTYLRFGGMNLLVVRCFICICGTCRFQVLHLSVLLL